MDGRTKCGERSADAQDERAERTEAEKDADVKEWVEQWRNSRAMTKAARRKVVAKAKAEVKAEKEEANAKAAKAEAKRKDAEAREWAERREAKAKAKANAKR
jgi:hypothetical protein